MYSYNTISCKYDLKYPTAINGNFYTRNFIIEIQYVYVNFYIKICHNKNSCLFIKNDKDA